MACRLPPTSDSAFDQATAKWPTRSRASDGACPSRAHSSNNPTSDHEPDWRLDSYSCAYDLTHDPNSGCDAIGRVADGIVARRDGRVKYLIRFNFRTGRDELCGPQTGWHWDGISSRQHDNHLHVSLHHAMQVMNDTRPWFGDYAPPIPEPLTKKDDDVAQMVYPDEPLSRGKLRGRTPTLLVSDAGIARLLTTRDIKTLLFMGAPNPVEMPREFVEGFSLVPRMDGRR